MIAAHIGGLPVEEALLPATTAAGAGRLRARLDRLRHAVETLASAAPPPHVSGSLNGGRPRRDVVVASSDVLTLLDELDRDPTCIFWG